MRTLLLISVLLMFFSANQNQNPSGSQENSSVKVVAFKWSKTRQVVEKLDPGNTSPAAAMTSADKNFQRNVRVNDPAGVRDPNLDSIDGRSAALEKSVQDSRKPQPKPIDGFAYRVKVQNTSPKVIEVLFWEYQFSDKANPANVARRQFLCGVNIRPDKQKELQAFSLSGPSGVVDAGSLAKPAENAFQEGVVINRVEYADGSIWQRQDWNFAEIKLTYARAVRTPWGSEMCRGL